MKYINEMENYLYNHNYISEHNNNIKQQELSVERGSCIVQKYRTLTEEKDKEIQELTNNWNELENYVGGYIYLLKTNPDIIEEGQIDTLYEVLDKMKEIKEGKK